jgi:hypothetical protein
VSKKVSIEIYRERREAVAAAITQNPTLFDMSDYARETECGTEACIAGWAAVIASQRGEIIWNRGMSSVMDRVATPGRGTQHIITWAGEWLGLKKEDVSPLFHSMAPHQTPEEAALAIKNAPYFGE